MNNMHAVVDTGASAIVFPTVKHNLVKMYLNGLNIPSLVLPEHPLSYPKVHRDHISMFPDLFITLQSSGAVIRIPKERIVVCYDAHSLCLILIVGSDYPNIILGAPLFTSWIVEFDTAGAEPRIGFCDPRDTDTDNTPLFTLEDRPAIVRLAVPPTTPSSHKPSSMTPPVDTPDWELYVPLRLPDDLVEDSDEKATSSMNSEDIHFKEIAVISKGVQNTVDSLIMVAILFISNFIIA